MSKITLEERTEYKNIDEILADGYNLGSAYLNFYAVYKGETMYAFKQKEDKIVFIHKWNAREDIKEMEELKHRQYNKTHKIVLEQEYRLIK